MNKPEFGERGSFTDLAFDSGAIWATERLLRLFRDYGVIRDSMIGPDWIVVYSEDGPLDFKLSKIKGFAEQGQESKGKNEQARDPESL